MTESHEPQDQPPGDKAVQPMDEPADDILRVLVATAQGADFRMSITLMTTGGVVSGVLVGRNTWLKELAEQGASEPEIGGFLNTIAEIFTLDPPVDDAGQRLREDPSTFGFIHLVDARIQTGNTVTPTFEYPGMYWRGRLSQVAGFNFGAVTAP